MIGSQWSGDEVKGLEMEVTGEWTLASRLVGHGWTSGPVSTGVRPGLLLSERFKGLDKKIVCACVCVYK